MSHHEATWPATADAVPAYEPPKPDVDCFPVAVDKALAGRRCCQYCGAPAEVFDVDGAWCTPTCQTYDRQSEVTIWRKAVES